MDELRIWTVRILVGTFVILLFMDCLSRLCLATHWEVPAPLYALIGTIVGGLFSADILRRRNGKGKNDKEVTNNGR